MCYLPEISVATAFMLSIWWHKSTQVLFCLCYLLNAKKDRTMFVSTCVIKARLHQRYLDFKWDLKFSLSRFNVEKEMQTERVLSQSNVGAIGPKWKAPIVQRARFVYEEAGVRIPSLPSKTRFNAFICLLFSSIFLLVNAGKCKQRGETWKGPRHRFMWNAFPRPYSSADWIHFWAGETTWPDPLCYDKRPAWFVNLAM